MVETATRHIQIIPGLVPPQQGEAVIRMAWPSVAAFPGPASIGRLLMESRILAPLGWLLLAPLYFMKVVPGLARRFVLTNRRLMYQSGFKYQPSREIPLAEIDEVRIKADGNNRFYCAADLEICSGNQVRMTLRGVPEADSFRHAILNACSAWVPGKAAQLEKFISATASKPS